MIRNRLRQLEKATQAINPACPVCGGAPMVFYLRRFGVERRLDDSLDYIGQDGRCRACGCEAQRVTICGAVTADMPEKEFNADEA